MTDEERIYVAGTLWKWILFYEGEGIKPLETDSLLAVVLYNHYAVE